MTADDARNIKLLIAYDGTEFNGWQRQKETAGLSHHRPCTARTVQGVIEEALKKMHGRPVNLTGSGRTDAGVHAAEQSANFYTNMGGVPPQRFAPALNTLLPQDVRILESCEVAGGFHARFSAISRAYRYQFMRRPIPPTEARCNLPLFHFPRIDMLNAYGRLLSGEIDCTIFAAADDAGRSKNRYIYKAYFYIEGNRLIFEICANAFLRKMVRSIAGTFLHYEEKNTPPEKLREIIASKDRSLAGPTLPPQGLFLWKVEY
jgi:tRNA pseudouridine38-40 synthase